MPRHHKACEVRRAIEQKLQPTDFRGTKELNYWIQLDGKKITRVAVTKSDEELKSGTEASIRNQLKVSREQFNDLVTCTMSGAEYFRILKGKVTSGIL